MPNNPVTKAILNQAPPEPADDSLLSQLMALLGRSREETPLARRLRMGETLDPMELATLRAGLKGRTPQVDPRQINPAFSPYLSEEAITRGDIDLETGMEDDSNRRAYEILQQILRERSQ